MLSGVAYGVLQGYRVPLKCNLTVLTQNSILDVQSFPESSFEAQVSSFDFPGSRTEFQDT